MSAKRTSGESARFELSGERYRWNFLQRAFWTTWQDRAQVSDPHPEEAECFRVRHLGTIARFTEQPDSSF
jgi:hypothetical protein